MYTYSTSNEFKEMKDIITYDYGKVEGKKGYKKGYIYIYMAKTNAMISYI